MMRCLLQIIPLVMIMSFSSVTQAKEDLPRQVSHGLGLAAGGTSGVGVAYRGSTEVIGWQTTLGAFGTSRYFDMFGGVELLYYFHKTDGGHRWYGLVGSGFVLESLHTLR